MQLLPLSFYPSPGLLRPTVAVENFDASLKRLAERMLETMLCNRGMGLAANQVGDHRSVIVYQLPWQIGSCLLINPSWQPVGEDLVPDTEGCLSLPGARATVKRYAKITGKCQGVFGDPIEFEAKNLEARVIQHEVDHLQGKLFIDHLSPFHRNMVLEKYRKNRRHTQTAVEEMLACL